MKTITQLHEDKKGVSLVELQVSMGIAIVVLTCAVSLYIFYWRTFVIGNNMLDVYANSRIAITLISRDIRTASQVVDKYPESGAATYTTADDVIVLKAQSISAAGALMDSKYDYIIYKLQGTDLKQIVKPYSAGLKRIDTNKIVARYCSLLSFSAPTVSGGVETPHGLSYFVGNSTYPLSGIDYVSVYLPINKQTISLSGSGVPQVASIEPTTKIKLRNK